VRLIVVIPTYNEAENLPKLVSALFDLEFEELQVLIVDDNSPDGSGRLANDLAQKYPGRMEVMHRSGKLGLGTAYLSGFRQAMQMGAQAIAQMDADFSHPPEKLPVLVDALDACDVALGSRYIPGGSVDERWPLWRKGLSAFGNLYARSILRIPIRDVTGGFRVWRRETLERMPLECVHSNGYGFQVEMIYLAYLLGYVASEIPFYFADRRWGQSKMSFRIQREAAVRVWRILFEYRGFKRQG